MKKLTGLPKKSTPTPHHHSSTISPQPMLSEKSSLHDKSIDKSKHKSITPGSDKYYDERPGLSLPEVKGADSKFLSILFYLYSNTQSIQI